MEIEFGLLGEFPYSIHKHESQGHLCGYLAVPPGHPWYGRGVDWSDGLDVDVHGGITYHHASVWAHPALTQALRERIAEIDTHGEYEEGSFLPAERMRAFDQMMRNHWQRGLDDESERAGEAYDYPHELPGVDCWWLGFDCAHVGDLVPGMRPFNEKCGYEERDTYRDRDYVYGELESMARQAAEAQMGATNLRRDRRRR